jgi:hypothetical protein
MKFFTKALAGLAMVATLGGAAHASTINIGGVSWNPDATSLADSDFTARYEFNQFFTSAGNQVANTVNAAPDYSKAVNPLTVHVGDVLQGAGEIGKFNGVSYGNTASTTGGAFCASCELTFTFGGFAVTGPGTFSNGWLRMYVDNTPDFDVSNSPASKAADGTLFLELTAVDNQFTGASNFASGFLTSLFSVTGGIAASNFDTNTQHTQLFVGDLLSSASAQFSNNNFLATSSGQTSGNSIPEPSTIFLLSLAMLGLAFARRKSASK